MRERSIKDEEREGCFAVAWERKEEGQDCGGDNQEFDFRHAEFEMPHRHPDGNVRQLIYKSGIQRQG